MTVLYICTDTRWQSVNLVPALAVGDIDSFVFLSARRGGDFERSDAVHAERPQRQFIAAYKLELARRRTNRAIEAARSIPGPLVGLQFWRKEISRIFAEAEHGATIVVNYLSGPSDVKAAAWLAAEDVSRNRPDLRIRFVLYDPPADKQPARLEWNTRRGSAWTERTEAIGHFLSLDGWLSLHGFVDADPATRLDRQRLAESLRLEIDRLFELVYREPSMPSGWYVQISGAIQSNSPNDLRQFAESRLSRVPAPQRAAALTRFAAIATSVAKKIDPRADCRLASFRGNADFIEFFRSTWFEMLVFLECRKRLVDNPGAEVVFDLKLGFSLENETPTYQIDVGIVANNQFHCVECKAFRETTLKKRTRQSREHLNHLRRIKEELVGPGGIALLASALSTDGTSSTARYAEFGHLEFAAGWEEIGAALDRLARRCF